MVASKPNESQNSHEPHASGSARGDVQLQYLPLGACCAPSLLLLRCRRSCACLHGCSGEHADDDGAGRAHRDRPDHGRHRASAEHSAGHAGVHQQLHHRRQQRLHRADRILRHECLHTNGGQHTRAIHARLGCDALRSIRRAGCLQPQPGHERAAGRRVDGRVRLLAERANRVDPEGQPRRGGFDAAGVVRVDRQPEPAQRRHPAALRRPDSSLRGHHLRRRDANQHRFQDRRHHPPVRRLVGFPQQPAQPVRDGECDRGDLLSARRLSECRARRRAVSGRLRRHRLLHDPEPTPSAADAAHRGRGAQPDRHHPRCACARACRGRLRPHRQSGRADQGEHHVLPGPGEDRYELHHRDPDWS